MRACAATAAPRAARCGVVGLALAAACPRRCAPLQHRCPRAPRRCRPCAAAGGGERPPKMFIPADGFGGEGPEAKGAAALSRLFTFVAIRVVQAQLEGLGNDGGFAPQATGRAGDVEAPPYEALRRAMDEVPLGDGDAWLEALLRSDAALAMRIMAVREAYAAEFDWQKLQALTARRIEGGNTRLMRAHVVATAGAGGAAGGASQDGADNAPPA